MVLTEGSSACTGDCVWQSLGGGLWAVPSPKSLPTAPWAFLETQGIGATSPLLVVLPEAGLASHSHQLCHPNLPETSMASHTSGPFLLPPPHLCPI